MKKFITQKQNNKFFLEKIIISLISFLLFFLNCNTSFAILDNKKLSLFKEDLLKVENYLNNIKNLSADFTQEVDKNRAEGKFYLSRNEKSSGKMRIEYIDKPKILLIVNGSILSYQDLELEEVSHISTNTTPASLLTRPNISFFAKDVEIIDIKKDKENIKISLVKKNRKEAGEFSIVFKNDPLTFEKMEVKNDLDQVISVKLSNIKFVENLPNNLFIIPNNN
jgi:outer membrane lipoprotein-sorting protein